MTPIAGQAKSGANRPVTILHNSPTRSARQQDPAARPDGAEGAAPPRFPVSGSASQPPARLVVLVAGNGSNLQAILDAIADARLAAEVVLVVSHRENAYALTRAARHGVATAVRTLAATLAAGGSREDYDAQLAALVATARPDLVVCAGWMLILGPRFLRPFGALTINLHPALPGTFVGKDAILRAWEAAQRGELATTGVMVHRVIADLDAGEPLAVEEVAIAPGETLEALTGRMHAAEHRVLIAAIARELAGESAARVAKA